MPNRDFPLWPTKARPYCSGRAKGIPPSSSDPEPRARGPTKEDGMNWPDGPKWEIARAARGQPTLRYQHAMRWGSFQRKRPVDFRWGLNMAPWLQGDMPRASMLNTGDISHYLDLKAQSLKTYAPPLFDSSIGNARAKTPDLSAPSPNAEDAPNPKMAVDLGQGVPHPGRTTSNRRRAIRPPNGKP